MKFFTYFNLKLFRLYSPNKMELLNLKLYVILGKGFSVPPSSMIWMRPIWVRRPIVVALPNRPRL